MHRIDTPTAQKDKFGAGKNGFTAGNPQTGTPATDLDNDYFDMLQEELASVVEAAGIVLDKSVHNQLLQAIPILLGFNNGSLLPVGTPIPWPLATPPTGFLKMNGATFDKVANPKLALAYPSGALPDLRAQTIRGWDDGRGIDTGRALLSEQGDAIRNIIGSAANVYTGNPDLATGVITYTGTGITSWQSGTGLSISYRNLNINAATQVPTAAENRVKSVAFNYIVRAQ
ncbi:tail fiber protein [Citrobacter braakii]|uniref:Tail fiber protein n=1 Tax=Citrobacter braakii TaxID=57706 RepID=A0ABR6TXW3_CITBR|nr:phage tail protein [Citrobacter braakii]MBC2611716.1 tail fiber protein [Citrobacter braakii]MBC2635688.1 tail fiber protein [Citrobacter braakii]MBC2648407.1 tail fiber protein [Citrobacter braakii]